MSTARSGRRLLPAVIVGLALVLVIAIAAVISRPGTASGEPVGNSVPVALSIDGLPKDTTIGVILSLGSAQGAEWRDAAQGAAVAAHRLAAGGSPLALVTRDDRGTADGARAAVAELAESGVSGIVMASAGEHVAAGVQAAREAGIPVLLPYHTGPLEVPSGSWRLAPGPDQVSAALRGALGEAQHVLLIDLGGPVPENLPIAERRTPAPGESLDQLATEVSGLAGARRGKPVDAVLLSGSATRQAAMVRALQQQKIELPLVLGPAATSPGFVAALHEHGASASGRMTSVGTDAVDATALRPGVQGQAMSGFLAAVRALAADPQAMNLTGDRPFAQLAGQADAASHDAVIALAQAAARAGSTAPGEVAAQLDTLSLRAADGIAAGELRFDGHRSASAKAVVLHLTTQDLGLRPAAAGAAATARWFAGPAGS